MVVDEDLTKRLSSWFITKIDVADVLIIIDPGGCVGKNPK